MNLRAWVAAPLAAAAVAVMPPSPCVAAQASARHVSTSLRLHEDDDGPHGPWRPCHSPRGVVLIDKTLRAILTNGRRGPEAVVLEGDPGSSSSPAAPWTSFSVTTYLDATYPVNTSGQYQFEIRDFFRVHPLFVVKAFDDHRRVFPFPATHCNGGKDGGGREDRARPHGGTPREGSPSGSPLPRTGAPSPLPRLSTAAGRSANLLSGKNIAIAAGGLLMVSGTLAAAWLRRRRSAD